MSQEKTKTQRASDAVEVLKFAALGYVGEIAQDLANVCSDIMSGRIEPERFPQEAQREAKNIKYAKKHLAYIEGISRAMRELSGD